MDLAAQNNEKLYLKPERSSDLINREFLAMFKNDFTDKYGDDMNLIRDDPNFNASHIGLLIDMIESGASSYSLHEKV